MKVSAAAVAYLTLSQGTNALVPQLARKFSVDKSGSRLYVGGIDPFQSNDDLKRMGISELRRELDVVKLELAREKLQEKIAEKEIQELEGLEEDIVEKEKEEGGLDLDEKRANFSRMEYEKLQSRGSVIEMKMELKKDGIKANKFAEKNDIIQALADVRASKSVGDDIKEVSIQCQYVLS